MLTTVIAPEEDIIFFCQDRRLVARVLPHCYQFLQDRHRSSNTGHPTGSGHKRTPYPTGCFSTAWRFSPLTSNARISAVAYFWTAWLPAAQLQGGRVWVLRLHTAHRYVSPVGAGSGITSTGSIVGDDEVTTVAGRRHDKNDLNIYTY